jgi:hypothetical protein
MSEEASTSAKTSKSIDTDANAKKNERLKRLHQLRLKQVNMKQINN